MKKILIYSLMIGLGLTACEKEEKELPFGTVDERLNEVIEDYKEQLVNAEYGWKATLFPEGGAGYSFLFDFAENDRVRMLSDINSSTASETLESTYRIKALQHPSLLFDTYSYLHVLSDPDASKSGGDWGEGKYSDFEFRFESATADSIVLTGVYNGSKMVLVRATSDEASQYISSIAHNAEAFEQINNFTTYFKRLTIGDKIYDIEVDSNLRLIAITSYPGGVANTFISNYYYTEGGLRLIETFSDGEITIREIGAPEYDAQSGKIDLIINNQEASIKEATIPLNPTTASVAINFNESPANGMYWGSFSGFTIKGVQDAFDIRSIPQFEFLVYWPEYNASGDLLGFVLFNEEENQYELGFGPYLQSTITNDGRIIFSFKEEFAPVPDYASAAVSATRDQLTIPEGYYVIQTSENSYDLVSAKDAKAWISFF